MRRTISRKLSLGQSAKAWIVTGGAIALLALPGAAMADDACHAVALAKYLQWQQPRLMRQLSATMADGRVKSSEMIFTTNTLYYHGVGVWRAGQIFMKQREEPSPEIVGKALGLADCQAGEQADEGGQAATVYSYKSTSGGYETSLQMWISNATGLPLREEMRGNPLHSNQAVLMVATYSYNSDVAVPLAAQTASNERLQYWRHFLNSLQSGEDAN